MSTAGPILGILMLDTRFPRIAGDIGHEATFEVPVLRRAVRGASPRRVVQEGDPALLAPFVAAARELVDAGATAIATSCGFLVAFQRELEDAVPVPVWTSSLLLLRELGPSAGVVTVDAASLSSAHLRAAGAAPGTAIEGLAEDSAFRRTLLDDHAGLDVEEARRSTVGAACRLVGRRPELTAIVLECTNMPPYAADVARATGRTVHDITTLIARRFAATATTAPT